jgi:hypothetical protein
MIELYHRKKLRSILLYHGLHSLWVSKLFLPQKLKIEIYSLNLITLIRGLAQSTMLMKPDFSHTFQSSSIFELDRRMQFMGCMCAFRHRLEGSHSQIVL